MQCRTHGTVGLILGDRSYLLHDVAVVDVFRHKNLMRDFPREKPANNYFGAARPESRVVCWPMKSEIVSRRFGRISGAMHAYVSVRSRNRASQVGIKLLN